MVSVQNVLQMLISLATLDFVPKGLLTRLSGGLLALVGLGELATVALVALTTGEVPTLEDLQMGVGMVSIGGAVAGGARKAEALSVELANVAKKRAR